MLLLAANATVVSSGLLLAILMTHVMGQDELGAYRYAVSFSAALATLIQLGVPYTASVALARNPISDASRIVIATVLFIATLGTIVGLAVVSVVALLRVCSVDVPSILLLAAFMPVVNGIQLALTAALAGANAIGAIAQQSALPPILLLSFVMAFRYTTSNQVSAVQAVLCYYLAYGLTHALTLWKHRNVTRRSLLQSRNELQRLHHDAGRYVYIGSVAAVAVMHGLNFYTGTVIGLGGFALYSLAFSIASPVQALPSLLGTALFRKNATLPRLPRKAIYAAIGIACITVIVFIVGSRLLFPYLFPAHFSPALGIAQQMAFAFAVYGVGDFFNRFLGSKGHGKALMRAAIASGSSNAAITLSLVPVWGAKGAVLGLHVASLAYLTSLLRDYKRLSGREPSHDQI
jgi:O-antigen/teichoic acid export membrane protein